jgi:DNA helicase TIP49 (TBP-interacting protein)
MNVRYFFQGQVLMEVTPTPTISAPVAQTKKVATHSHIRGLGLKEDGGAEPISAGFVGQLKAREVRTI